MRRQIVLTYFLIYSSVIIGQNNNEIQSLERLKRNLESQIIIKQDSLKIVNTKINQLKIDAISKSQPEQLAHRAIISMNGKIRKGNDPNSVALTEVQKNDTVLLTDYSDGYWMVTNGTHLGFINEVFIVDNQEIKKFKELVLYRKKLSSERAEEELRQKKIAERQAYEEKIRVENEKKRLADEKIKAQQEAELREINRKNAEESRIKRELERKQAEEQRIADEKKEAARKLSLIEKYGKKTGERLINKEYWIGMTSEMALDGLGVPESKVKNVDVKGEHETWMYSRFILNFDNKKLTSYQEVQ